MGLKFRGFRAKFTLKPKRKEPEIVCLKYHVYHPDEEESSSTFVKPIPKTRSFLKTKPKNEETPEKNQNGLKQTEQTTNLDMQNGNIYSEAVNTVNNNALKSTDLNTSETSRKQTETHSDNKFNTNEINSINEDYTKSTLIFMTENNEEMYATSDIKDDDEAPPSYKLNTHPYRQNFEYKHEEEDVDNNSDDNNDDQNENDDNYDTGNLNFATMNNHYSDEAASIFFGGEEAAIPNRMRNINLNRDENDNASEYSQTSA